MAKDAAIQETGTLRRAPQSRVTLADYKRLTEKAWLRQVTQLAQALGWISYHAWLSIHSARGWPDLALVRERLILAELKSETGKVTPDQQLWLDRLHFAKVECYIWRPSDFDEVVQVLTKRSIQIQTSVPRPGMEQVADL